MLTVSGLTYWSWNKIVSSWLANDFTNVFSWVKNILNWFRPARSLLLMDGKWALFWGLVCHLRSIWLYFVVDGYRLIFSISFWIGTGAIIWLPQWLWNNPEEYGLIHHITTKAKQSITIRWPCSMGYILEVLFHMSNVACRMVVLWL